MYKMAAVIGDLNLPFLSSLNQGNGLKGGDIIELCGDPGTCKSELLLNMAAEAVIPHDYKEHYLGGCDMGVVFISTNRKFDLIRLVTLIEYRLAQRMHLNNKDTFVSLQDVDILSSDRYSSYKKPTIDRELIMSCLEQLYLFNCDSLHELCMTTIFLKSFILNNPRIGLILIDQALITDPNTELLDSDMWISNLKTCISHRVGMIIVTDPHSRLGQEWMTHTCNITKQRTASSSTNTSTNIGNSNHFLISSSVRSGQLHHFTVSKDGPVWL